MTLTFLFLVKMINNAKSKLIVSKNARNWPSIYQTWYFVKIFIFMISTWCIYYAVHLVLQLGKSFDRFEVFCSLLAPGCKVKTFFQISWFYWIHLMIPEKMKPCLLKLEPGFWIYGWKHLSGPICGQNVGSRPQAPSLRHLLRFCDFIGFISWFLKKMRHCLWILLLELGFCLLCWICFLGPSGPNLVSRQQGQDIFWDFIILLDLSNDSWKNEV